jgi:hypothetical protein
LADTSRWSFAPLFQSLQKSEKQQNQVPFLKPSLGSVFVINEKIKKKKL